MRLLYDKFPICETLSHKLTWSHVGTLLQSVPIHEKVTKYHFR
ncbi:MAG: hypothetical protein WCK78_01110 [Paludibacter sp.]